MGPRPGLWYRRRVPTPPPDDVPTVTEPEEFFEGLGLMAAYLSRQVNNPDTQRTLLECMVQDLLKPRSARTLSLWLLERLAKVLHAERAQSWVREQKGPPSQTGDWGDWTLWHQIPEKPRAFIIASDQRPEQAQHRLMEQARARGRPLVGPGRLIVPLETEETLCCVLWLACNAPPEPSIINILEALCGAAGMIFSQALHLERLWADTPEGLLSRISFMDQCAAELRHLPSPTRAPLLLGLRAELRGTGQSQDLINALFRAVTTALRRTLSPGTPITGQSHSEGTKHWMDSAALLMHARSDAIEATLQDLDPIMRTELARELGKENKEIKEIVALSITHLFPDPAIDDLSALLIRLEDQLSKPPCP